MMEVKDPVVWICGTISLRAALLSISTTSYYMGYYGVESERIDTKYICAYDWKDEERKG
jgi:hypothetical protein